MLGNKFAAISFNLLNISMAKICKFQIWIKTDLRHISTGKISKRWMFYIVSDAKPFIKSECSVTQSSAMTHSYKWAIVGVLSGKIFFSTVDPSYNKLWRDHGILFDIIMAQKWTEK